jgi:glyoxylase-like metal-dependent hydrolase (beta-lactamase superfamily II)
VAVWLASLGAGPAAGAADRDSLKAYLVRELAPAAYAVPGDSGRGVEGRANAGFVVTDEGVVVIDALGSPLQGRRLVASIRSVTDLPIRWLILTHHHPDHAFGAAALREAGAQVLAHPDAEMQAGAGGDSSLAADWAAVVGEEEMRGFTFADRPDVPVTRDTTLSLGDTRLVIGYPGPAHTRGDLFVWLPAARVLFAGDLVVEDGMTMLNDGSSAGLLAALDRLAALDPAVLVPGHGRIPNAPGALIAETHAYVDSLRGAMRQAFESGTSLNAVVASLPPADPDRPVSFASRRRRNAVRVYVEIERQAMGLDSSADQEPADVSTPVPSVVSTADLAKLVERGEVTLVDVRADFAQYLQGHLPGAVYLNSETLRAEDGGLPNQLLPRASYATLFARLGVRG